MGARTSIRSLVAILGATAALGFAACGDDEEPTTSTVTQTETTEETTTSTSTTTPSSSGEASDLPSCDQGVYPCIEADGSVTSGPP